MVSACWRHPVERSEYNRLSLTRTIPKLKNYTNMHKIGKNVVSTFETGSRKVIGNKVVNLGNTSNA
jgi:methanogenic corrinoid protein MtbC1